MMPTTILAPMTAPITAPIRNVAMILLLKKAGGRPRWLLLANRPDLVDDSVLGGFLDLPLGIDPPPELAEAHDGKGNDDHEEKDHISRRCCEQHLELLKKWATFVPDRCYS